MAEGKAITAGNGTASKEKTSNEKNRNHKKGVFASSRLFIKESVEELKKVSTPTRKEAWQETLRALLLVVVFSLVLSLFDWTFKTLVWQLV